MIELYNTRITSEELLQTPLELMQEISMTRNSELTVRRSRNEFESILDRYDDRFVIIAGPCSIHNVNEGLEFSYRFKGLRDKVNDKIMLIMRTYFEKPRTCIGWTGLIEDPYLDDSCNIAEGLRITRRFLSNVTDIDVPCYTEVIEPINVNCIADYLTGSAIGARTSESPVHRRLASGLSMPVGFKNNTAGDISAAVDGAKAARYSYTFSGPNLEGRSCVIKTTGNHYSHVILRGGNGVPNCTPELVAETLKLLEKAEFPIDPTIGNVREYRNIIIDCSHGNSEKKYERQEQVAYKVVDQRLNGNPNIIGIMLEANDKEGKQPFPSSPEEIRALKKGVSITDGCVSFETLERMVINIYNKL